MNEQWVQWNLYYYSEQREQLILDLIQNIHRDLLDKKVIKGFYFLSHWSRGPHIRLRFQTDNVERFNKEAVPWMVSEVQKFLKKNPSLRRLNKTDYRNTQHFLAELEEESGDFENLHPDNTFIEGVMDDRSSVLGSTEAFELLNEFHIAATPFIYEVLENTRGNKGKKLGICFDMLTITGEKGYKKGIELSFLSYRSHANAFMISSKNPLEMQELYQKTYLSRKKELNERLNQVIEQLHSNSINDDIILKWSMLISSFKLKIMELLKDGIDLLGDTNKLHKTEYAHMYGESLEHSKMHFEMDNSKNLKEFMSSSIDFLALRVLLNYTYLIFHRLGIHPLERFVVCNLVASAVENIYQVDAARLIQEQEKQLKRGGWQEQWETL
ncbi:MULTISPECIES: lantibiotic dehydratase C-terminal domain-containing protein [unclassified Bacillus (in: firmicutes)]|uniref:lantibiotic dehydratase C-terminal domain-containing protein n=1 Tax=unclassified Bacillus (in: firmicutes) TaxID=185979 RepID=UPI001596902A|nr:MULTISPECIES: lantibiotic dehydratase C-terminal domain-containing protein [unclassified Bacillus (in: firmicutes)]